MNFLVPSSLPLQQPPQPAVPFTTVESLVISNLPSECKEPDLLVLAQSYGRVKSCEFKRDFRNHVITVNAILTFYDLESTERAFHYLNGANYFGKTLRVEWMNRSGSRGPLLHSSLPSTGLPAPGPAAARSNNRTAQVHFSYLSKQLQFIITEKFLFEVFSNYGEVLEVALKKTSVDPEMAVQNGYGFIHFPLTPEGVQAALNTVKSMHRVTLNQITFDCSVSNQLNQVLVSMEKKSMQQQHHNHHHRLSPPVSAGFPLNYTSRENANYLPPHHLSHAPLHHLNHLPSSQPQQLPRGNRSYPAGFGNEINITGMPNPPQQQLNRLARPPTLTVQAPAALSQSPFDISSFSAPSPLNSINQLEEKSDSHLAKLSAESMMMLETSTLEILRAGSNSSDESTSPMSQDHQQQQQQQSGSLNDFRSSFASSTTSSSNLSNSNHSALFEGLGTISSTSAAPAPFSLWSSANY